MVGFIWESNEDRIFSGLVVVSEVLKIRQCSSLNWSLVVSSFVHHEFNHDFAFTPVEQSKVRSDQGNNLWVWSLSTRVKEEILHEREDLFLKLDAVVSQDPPWVCCSRAVQVALTPCDCPCPSPDLSIRSSVHYKHLKCAASSAISWGGVSSILCLDGCRVRWLLGSCRPYILLFVRGLMVGGRLYGLLLNGMLPHHWRNAVMDSVRIVIIDLIEGDIFIDEWIWQISNKASKLNRLPTIWNITLVPEFIHAVSS